jgi:glycosyltransferase involved in cell wall biosynthesis
MDKRIAGWLEETDISKPNISVIIPSYNSADTLPAAIESILGQTHLADEIIVVDDGSPPGDGGFERTADACAPYFRHIRLIRQRNAGASAARNTGIAPSRGELLAFLDADDVWEPNKLKTQLAALEQNPDAAFCTTAANAWSPTQNSYVTYAYTGSTKPSHMIAELLVRNILSGICSSILIRREALLSVGGFAHGKGSEDRRLAIDLLRNHLRGIFLPDPLVKQRPGPAHWTDPQRQKAAMLDLIRDYDDMYRQLDPTGRLKRRAIARVHERTGMHYLENGDLLQAGRSLTTAILQWPFMANPWKVLLNTCLGRIHRSIPSQASASC